MDESNPTCNKRFARLKIPQTEEARRAYRELIVTTPNLGECISGAILYDETIRQQKKDGTPFIKVLIGPRRRTRSSHGRRAYIGSVLCDNRTSFAYRRKMLNMELYVT